MAKGGVGKLALISPGPPPGHGMSEGPAEKSALMDPGPQPGHGMARLGRFGPPAGDAGAPAVGGNQLAPDPQLHRAD